MPKHKVPAEKPYDMPESGKAKPRQPSVYVPMKPEWLKKLSVGDKVEITLHGEIIGTHLDESKNRSRSEAEIEVTNVSYYESDDNAKVLTEEEDE